MKLYIDHYTGIYSWKKMAFAVREWILREYHSLIVDDLKFLTRKWIEVILYHNIWINRWNKRFIQENIVQKLPSIVGIERISWDKDLYAEILNIKQDVDKLIILERQFLYWEDWKKINTISTNKLEGALLENDINRLWIWNINFRQDLLTICKSIEEENIHRVHILPAWKKHAIKNELFSLEGSWTLIGNDFGNPEIVPAQGWDEDILTWILSTNWKSKFLKPRTKEYIIDNISHFRIAKVDNIPVWCMEIIPINSDTIELWALAVIKGFLSFKIWFTLVDFAEKYASKNRLDIISLTNNPKLESIYKWRWFREDTENLYWERSKKSPWVKLFILDYNKNSS